VGTYGYSPEEAQFGFTNIRPNGPLRIEDAPVSEEQHLENVKINQDRIYERIASERHKSREQHELLQNAKRKERVFTEGQLVYVVSQIIAYPSGLIKRKRGPYEVLEVSTHSQSVALKEISTGKLTKSHFTYLVPVKETKTPTRLNSGWDIDLQAVQRARRIASRRQS
jgi:hypothetical protein